MIGTRRPGAPQLALLAITALSLEAWGQTPNDRLAAALDAIEPKVIAWRRDIHEHPELGNRETRTATLVADHLRGLGLEVRTGVAHTGVVGLLRGGHPGPVIALRADMDALPVTEKTGLPFASTTRTTVAGVEVGVMHACGHDAHTAMLMGAAEVLAGIRDDLDGTVEFIFQPAEEGPPSGEDGGARLMIEQGILEGEDAPEAIFGLHVWPGPAGMLSYRAEGIMAAADSFRIGVEGVQTHGAYPWRGIDSITVAAQIVTALQMIPSRQLDVTLAPAVISVGRIQGGMRFNIIPEFVELEGTIRTFDAAMRDDIIERIERTASQIAASAGAKASVTITSYAPAVYNDPALTARVSPSLERAAGADQVRDSGRIMASEDFALYQDRIPGFYFFLGINRPGVGTNEAAPNHSPYFDVNEDALIVGVRALTELTTGYAETAGR